MKKSVRIGTVVVALSLLIGIGCTISKVYAHASWTETTMADSYELLSVFEVPQRQVTVNGETVVADTVVTLPDGTSTKADEIKLKLAGMYMVTYTAHVDDNYYVEEETFLVHNKLYSFTSEDSSATYGKYEHAKDTEGLMVRLAEGDTLTLTKPIDLTALQEEEWLLQAFATPDVVGYSDFEKLCFQFTDVNDPEATLYISARQANWDDTLPYTYYVAGGDEQTPKGYETGNAKIHEEGYYGAVGKHSFGLGNELCAQYCDEQMMNFRVDFETMEVHSKEQVVIDLDSPEHFDSIWAGFPSGKAYLTIWADLYGGKTANFCLVKAGNIDLKQELHVDDQPPVITVDAKYQDVPPAVKGGSYQYIPTATAVDAMSGECEVTTKVYYNYQSPDSTVLDIKKGAFKTARIGYYAVVYEATDAFGNLGREIIWVKAEKTLEKPTIDLKDKPVTEWVLGEKYVPVEYTYTCHSGQPNIDVYATKGKKTYRLNDGFRFEEKGKYKVVYEVTDCAGQRATYEHTLQVKVGDRPVLGQDVQFPRYLVEESEYTFPKITFFDYRSGKKEKKIGEGKIIDATGTTKVKAGETYKVTAAQNGENVKIVLVCENASYTYEIPTIKTWGTDNGKSRVMLENFFISSGMECETGNELIFKATAPDGKWSFANPLLSRDFTMELQAVTGNMQYESILIEMQDSENAARRLTFELPYEKDVLSVKIGEKKQILKKGGDLETVGTILVEYKENALYVAGVKIKNTNFSGFESDNIYLSVGFKQAGEKAAFRLNSIQNHIFGSSRKDRNEPKVVILGDRGGTYSFNDEIELCTAVAADVLNPNITFSMTVMHNKEVVEDIDGKLLKDVDPAKVYTIKAEQYGEYNVIYTAYDSFSEKDMNMSYIIHITDDVMPTIKFEQKKVTRAKAGDIIYIPDYAVSDNISEEETLLVQKYVEDPNGVLIPLLNTSNSIVASEVGTYKFIVLVMDEQGNMRNESWTVTVTEN